MAHAESLTEKLIQRSADDAAATLRDLRTRVDAIQRALGAAAGPAPATLSSQASDGPAVAQADHTGLLSTWLADCTHALNALEETLLAIESGVEVESHLTETRRKLHTLKGECGVLSLHTAQSVLHQAESAVDCVGSAPPGETTDALLAVVDWMRAYADRLGEAANAAPPDPDALLARLRTIPAGARPFAQAPERPPESHSANAPEDAPQPTEASGRQGAHVSFTVDPSMADTLGEFLGEAREHLSRAEQALLELEQQPGEQELLNTVFRAFHTIKGVAGFMNLGPVVSLAHSVEFLLDAARAGKLALQSEHLSVVLQGRDLMDHMLSMMAGDAVPPIEIATLNALVAAIESLASGTSSTVPVPVSRDTHSDMTPPPPESAGDESPTMPTARQPGASPSSPPTVARQDVRRADQTVKVSTSRMDALVDMVGELVIGYQMIAQDPAIQTIAEQRSQRNLAMVGKIIRDLQEVSMSLRMVPIKGAFQRMARLVRDVSAKTGKRIEFRSEGDDVELDRNVVEEIADPLVHMVRNACDHGVEAADRRRAAGKPESGRITLRAFHSGGCIVVEIEDDGRGLSRDRILAKAIEKGIYAPDRPIAEISDAEVFDLVFLPGFSTAEKVTDISGRGVGMDVVRRNIEALRGKVEIRSTLGKGTVFSMRLPLTMAIIDGMVVRVGCERFVIPTLSIERTIIPKPQDLHTVAGYAEMALVRGDLLPIHDLAACLGRGQTATPAQSRVLVIVETKGGGAGSRACLAVDEIIGQQQVVIKSLGDAAPHVPGVSGGAILGDGRVALILDIAGVLRGAIAAAGQPSKEIAQ